MASGIITGSWSGSAKTHANLRLSWSSTGGINESGLPFSTVTVQPQWMLDVGGYTTNKQNSAWSATVDGTTSSGSLNFNVGSYTRNTWYNIGSPIVKTVLHDSDGTKTAGLSYSLNLSGTSFGTGSVSGSATLDDIAMGSTATVSPNPISVGSSAGRLSVTIVSNSTSYTHTVTCVCGAFSQSKNLTAGTTSTYFDIPASSFPSAKNGAGAITVTTKSGTSVVGTPMTTPFNINITAVPSVTLATAVVSTSAATLTGYCTDYTKVRLTATPTAGTGSSISKVEFYENGTRVATVTSSPWTWTRPNVFGASDTYTYKVVVTDGRGTAEASKDISVVKYTKPTISNVSLYRCNTAGTAQDDGERLYIKATASVSCASIGNSLSSMRYDYRLSTASTYTTGESLTSGTQKVTTNVFSKDNSYSIQIIAVDAMGQSGAYTGIISTQALLVDTRPNNKGIAFGKSAATDSIFDSAWRIQAPDARLEGGLISAPVVTGGSSTRLIVPQYLSFTALGVESGQYTDYFEALLKWLCYTYQGRSHCIFVGVAYPGTRGLYAILIYDTGTHASLEETTLPSTATGFFQRGSAIHEMYYWGTAGGVFYYNDVYSNTSSKTKNYVLAAPTTANGSPSFRKLVTADLPTDTASSGIVSAVSGATLSSQEVRKSGHFCQLCLEFSAGTVAGGGTITATIASAHRPVIGASGCGYWSASAFIAQLTSDGSLTIRNASGTLRTFTTDNPLRIAMSYYV